MNEELTKKIKEQKEKIAKLQELEKAEKAILQELQDDVSSQWSQFVWKEIGRLEEILKILSEKYSHYEDFHWQPHRGYFSKKESAPPDGFFIEFKYSMVEVFIDIRFDRSKSRYDDCPKHALRDFTVCYGAEAPGLEYTISSSNSLTQSNQFFRLWPEKENHLIHIDCLEEVLIELIEKGHRKIHEQLNTLHIILVQQLNAVENIMNGIK